MPSLLIKHIPEDVLSNIKKRSERNNRSVQDEVLYLLSSIAKLGHHDMFALSEKVKSLAPSSLLQSNTISDSEETSQSTQVVRQRRKQK